MGTRLPCQSAAVLIPRATEKLSNRHVGETRERAALVGVYVGTDTTKRIVTSRDRDITLNTERNEEALEAFRQVGSEPVAGLRAESSVDPTKVGLLYPVLSLDMIRL